MTDLPPAYDLAPLARLETNWCPPWLIARVAQHGPMHFSKGEPMDDSHIIGGAAGAFWMVAADGVGSQPMSRFGSRIACRAIDHFLGTRLSLGTLPTCQLLAAAFDAAHKAIIAAAKDAHRQPDNYATTLSAVLVRGNSIIGASIGDSGIAVGTLHEDGEGKGAFALTPFCSASQPPAGTFSITHPQWADLFATSETHSPHVTTIVVATDGANGFFLAPAEGSDSCFNPDWPATLEERLRQLTPLTFVNLFAHFIGHCPPENSDDRTLLVAYRPPADLAPPAEKPR